MQIKLDIDFSLTLRTKRALKWIALPFAVFAGTIAVAHAYDTTWIRASQPVSATSLKSNLDEIQSRLLALEQPVSVRVSLEIGPQGVSSGVSTIVGFDTIVYGPASTIQGLGSPVNFRFVAPVDGTYSIHTGVFVNSGSASWPSSASVDLRINKNGVGYSATSQEAWAANLGALTPSLSDTVKLHVGEFITVVVDHNGGSGPFIQNSAQGYTFLAIDRVGPY